MTLETLTKNKVISTLPKFWGAGKRNGNNGGDAKDTITILFGSETGNSEFIARETCKYLKSKGVKATCKSLFKYKPDNIVSEQQVLLVVSTHGEGDPPDAAEKFYKYLFEADIPKLSNLKYSVCALGDSSYDHFCKAGLDIDCQLEKLGANRICPCVECDVNFRDDAVKWISKAYQEISGGQKTVNGHGAQIEEIGGEEEWFTAKITDKYLLNSKDSDKETWHISFAVEDPLFSYKPGDCIGLMSKNDEMLVTLILNQLGFTGSEMVKTSMGQEGLFDALQKRYEVTAITKKVLKRYAQITRHDAILELLKDDQKAGYYLQHNDVLDLLQDYPASLEPQQFIDVLVPMQHRLYSIASSPTENPQQVDITVRSVKVEYRDRLRKGVCSAQLSDRFERGDEVKIFVKPNTQFRLPENQNIPVIMISSGTGIAPFRAFLQHRKLTDGSGKNWLFFGDRRRAHDFLYRYELEQFCTRGLLTKLDLAFSRDKKAEKYVQHLLFEERKELLRWLEEGAYIYICGLLKMADEVQECMIQIFMTEKRWTQQQAEEYLYQLKAERRYCEDAY